MTENEGAPGGVHQTGVDLSGLLTVVSQHLYSTPEVAIRELVQNAHDSITRRHIEHGVEPTDGSIRVLGRPRAGTLIIEDTGAGLTEEEIHSCLATVGAGYTGTLRELGDTQPDDASGNAPDGDQTTDRTDRGRETDRLIGRFGLGFLSAFVVADKVEVHTTSALDPTRSWRYVSQGGERYHVAEADARPVGTTVTLHLDREHRYLASGDAIEHIVGRYCALLTVPTFLGDAPEPCNARIPPWRSPEPASPTEVMAFASRYELTEPLCTIAVSTSGRDGAPRIDGVLWIQSSGSYATTDRRNLAVYVRHMLVDDQHRDLLPVWAGFAGGVVESDHLTPTASREDLQRDEAWENARAELDRALIDGLGEIARNQPETWRLITSHHNEQLLGAAVCDEELLALLVDHLRLPTTVGDLTLRELRSRGAGRIVVGGSATTGGFEEMLFRARGIPVVDGGRFGASAFIRAASAIRSFDTVYLGTDIGDGQIFRPEELNEELVDALTSILCGAGETLVPARFAPACVPLVTVIDRDAERKARIESEELDRHASVGALRLARRFTERIDDSIRARVYLNVDAPGVRAVLAELTAALDSTDERPIPAGTAALLLASTKVLLSANSEAGSGADLLGAFDVLNDAVTALTGTDAARDRTTTAPQATVSALPLRR